MKWRSPVFVAAVVSIILVIFLLGFVILRYLQGYNGQELIAGARDQLLAPPQDAYRRDSEIMAALQFLSDRWNTRLDNLYVLTLRRMQSFTELGVVDSSSLTSARLFIPPSTSFPDLQQLSADSISHEGNIYLMNEFKPTSPQEITISRVFYTTETPSLKASQDFALIVWWNIEPSGNGDIKALTNSGYLTIPVIRGVALKRLAHYAN